MFLYISCAEKDIGLLYFAKMPELLIIQALIFTSTTVASYFGQITLPNHQ